MSDTDSLYEVYLEVGQKKVFAAAVHWPGWCRFAKDEDAAVQALIDAAPRYAAIAKQAGLDFQAPQEPSAVKIIERLEGNTTTDFGAPDQQLPRDRAELSEDELERYVKLLEGCWWAFDQAVERAKGKELQKGPRGGGREVEQIVDHVLGAAESYLKTLGWKLDKAEEETTVERGARIRQGAIDGLRAAAAGEIPQKGPRGGQRWPPHYFVRRFAWHIVDHAWEIENRIID